MNEEWDDGNEFQNNKKFSKNYTFIHIIQPKHVGEFAKFITEITVERFPIDRCYLPAGE